jgi:UDP-3-O-[3-hydroxymyristoyl] glucosamine N-acyltransferase
MPASPITARQIAAFVQGRLIGRAEIVIDSVAGLLDSGPAGLSFIGNDFSLKEASSTRADVLLTHRHIPELTCAQIVVAHPALAMARVVEKFFLATPRVTGISNLAYCGQNVHLGENVSIWPFVTLQDDVKIGRKSHLYSGVFVGEGSTIGEDCVIYPNVTIRERVTIGNRVIIHPGTVIGSDGFGYVQESGRHHKIPQIGTVVIEDDVELGANVTIDRATFGATIVRRGTKVDNLVQIAHNVVIGEDNIVVAQVGIAGSSTTGRHVMVGGQAGIADHVTIGDQVMIAARSGLNRDVAGGEVVAGTPAMPHKTWLKAMAVVAKLPELREQLRKLETRLAALEKTVGPPHEAGRPPATSARRPSKPKPVSPHRRRAR